MGRLATDVGGTFTDLAYFDEMEGLLRVEKALTTPHDPSLGIQEVIERSKLEPEAVEYFVHGGTTVINAITERKGVKTALVTTKGFRDVLEIGRGNRPDLYNLHFQSPRPFVPRHLRFEVRERVDSIGNVLEPLHLEDLNPVVQRCRAESVDAIGILFLHSYAAPEHEAACATYLREQLPHVAVSASHEITREWREYERANTTVLNAYVQPIVQNYLDNLEATLRELRFKCPLFAMQSNGGTTTFAWAREHPITLIESGPAAGVNGAAFLGPAFGADNVISLDIGGTTAKCSVIEDATPKVTTEYKLEWSRLNPGYPVKVPVMDIVEIGAGGGSIAWFDDAGSLRVGPVSAGADPGPACYGQGGLEPTVTDAKLLAGVLNPDYFAGGRIILDVGKARHIMGKVAQRLRQSIQEAAISVIRVIEANMINALKLVSVQRGHDPRDFVLVASGGGGPMHAASLGRELGVREIVIPRYPGLFSAWGMLATAPRRDFVQTALLHADAVTIDQIRMLFEDMKGEAQDYFRNSGAAIDAELKFYCEIELRYHGQEHTVSVPVTLEALDVRGILESFHRLHERTFTFQLSDTPVEFVHFRLRAEADVPRPRFTPISADGRSAERAAKAPRSVNFPEDGRLETAVYERDVLPPDFSAEGPLLIEEPSSMTLVHQEQRLHVDDLGFLHITEAS